MSTGYDYPTNLSDEQWQCIEPLLPKPKWQPGGPGRQPRDLRTVVNGIFYVNKTGCQWYMLPRDFGPNRTIYGYFRRAMIIASATPKALTQKPDFSTAL